MARGFIRKPSFWKIVGAYRSQWKRSLRRMFIPGYGKKGMGWWRNPKKAFYNWWYNRTSLSLPRMLGYKPSHGGVMLAFTMACFLNVFAAPFDVAKTISKGHKRAKSRKKRAKKYGVKGSNVKSHTTASHTSVPETDAATTKSKSDANRSTNKAEREPKVKNDTRSKTEYSFPKIETERGSESGIVTEKINLFEPATVKVVEKPEEEVIDENTPKSKPKHDGDQYIRKRMIIAGSSYCDRTILGRLNKGTYLDVVAEPDNPYDKDAVALLLDSKKVGYIAKKDHLAFVTCLKLNHKIYAVITDVLVDENQTKYEFETWFDNAK